MVSPADLQHIETLGEENPRTLELIGKLGVRFRLLSEEQVQQAIAHHATQKVKARPGQSLIDLGFINEPQLTFLINAREMKNIRNQDIKFGSIAIENGFATQPQVDDVLLRQKQEFIKFKRKTLIGDMLVEDGTITEAQKQIVIDEQQRRKAERQAKLDEIAQRVDPSEKVLSAGEGIEFIVSKDGLKATLRAAPTIDQDALRNTVPKLLEEYNITFGVVSDEAIEAWITAGEKREIRFEIASGVAPVKGNGGTVKYHFDTDPLKAGKIKEGDIIDFKDRGETPQVEAGTLLAEIADPDPGMAGTDVHGDLIPAPTVREKKLLAADGAKLSGDRRSVIATIDGLPSLARRGAIAVYPLHRIQGNVGYKTGHVDFNGEIQVSGTIEKEFRVSGGKLSAKEIEAAEIEIAGDVIVKGGIIGAHIKVGGNLVASYIHNATIEADGDVMVKKEIMGSDIKSSGGVYSESCIILDSKIEVKEGVSAKDIGSDVSGPSTISIGSDAVLELHISELKERMEANREKQKVLQQQIDEGEAENEQINLDIADKAQVQDRGQIEIRELQNEREELVGKGEQEKAEELLQQITDIGERAKEAEEELGKLFERQDQIMDEAPKCLEEIEQLETALTEQNEELEELEAQLQDEQEDVYIKVVGTLFPMTTIYTTHSSVNTKQKMSKVVIREKVKRTESGGEIWKIVPEAIK